jgi:ABC-type phosphate transport system ATPase subunit
VRADGKGYADLVRGVPVQPAGGATGGSVRFHGENVAAIDPLALRRRVGMVFQRPTLFPGTGNLRWNAL